MHSPGGAAPLESERGEAVGRALHGPAHPWRLKAVLALFGAGYRAKGHQKRPWTVGRRNQVLIHALPARGGTLGMSLLHGATSSPESRDGYTGSGSRVWLPAGSQLCLQHTFTRK